MIWFTADSHFNHFNILKYCDRPFKMIKEHDDCLIENWNSCIKDTDTVYHLGDFGFGRIEYLLKIRHMLKGKIHLILGNHDKAIKGALKDSFESVSLYKKITIQDREMDHPCKIILFHYPIERWSKKHFGAFHFHGHSHGTCPTPPGTARMDVGVDCFNYYPVSYAAIKSIFTQRMMEIK